MNVELSEQRLVAKALCIIINTYDKLPVDRVEYQFLDADKAGLSVSIIPGGKQTYDIVGNMSVTAPFSVVYRAMPEQSIARMTAQNFLDELAQYIIEKKDDIKLDEHREVQNIEQTQNSVILAAYKDGTIDYQVTMSLNYRKEVE